MTFETVINWQSGHPDMHARLQWIALGIEPQNRCVLSNSILKQDHINAVMTLNSDAILLTSLFVHFFVHRRYFLSSFENT
jgi:hypothetical protein